MKIGEIIANGILLQYQPKWEGRMVSYHRGVNFSLDKNKFDIRCASEDTVEIRITEEGTRPPGFLFRCFAFDYEIVELEIWKVPSSNKSLEQVTLYESRINDPGCFPGIRQTIDECFLCTQSQ